MQRKISTTRHFGQRLWSTSRILLARLWQERGQRWDAYDLLAPVEEGCAEGFDPADLKEAKALLDELALGDHGRHCPVWSPRALDLMSSTA
jgi:predicted ATPase